MYVVTTVLVLALLGQAMPAVHPVEPRSTSRSAILDMRAGDTIVVRPVAMGSTDFNLGIEVYDETRTLVGRDNEESDVSVFEWEAPRAGRYYLIVRNFSGVRAGYSFTVGPSGRSRGVPSTSNHAVVRVFYATNRGEAPPGGPEPFTSEPRRDGQLALGTAQVSIPREHRMGELEGPSIMRLEFRQDPERHIVLLRTESQPAQRFFSNVASAAARSPRREAFVFVHGFATSFEDAARRTAQMAYDLGFEGAPIVYSWPSRGRIGPIDYTTDARNADLSSEPLRQFLERLVREAHLETVHVIAHSMGNRVLTSALDALTRGNVRLPELRQVALMAPDIDAELFRTLAARIKAVPGRLTLYASSGDAALQASQRLAGYPRAGQGGSAIIVLPGIDTIDASLVDTSLLGLRHSYYADNRTIVSDLFYLLRGTPPQDRAALRKKDHADGTYWEFAPAAR